METETSPTPWTLRLAEILFFLSRQANQWLEEPGTTQSLVNFYLRERITHGT